MADRRPALLTDDVPLPATLEPRLADQLRFLVEIDRLKAVLRASPLAGADRFENSAEHSWHLAMAVLVLAEHAAEPVDVARTLELVLVHDLVEVYAGDTPIHVVGETGQAERERAAADALFPLLPGDQARLLRGRWEEFEARSTPEARFAKAVDRFVPLLHNWMNEGSGWLAYGVTAEQVLARTTAIPEASSSLGAAARTLLAEADRRGWTASG